MSETASAVRARVRRLAGVPEEMAALREQVVALQAAVAELTGRLSATGQAPAPAREDAGSEEMGEDATDARLAALEDALDGVADRLESVARDAMATNSARTDEVAAALADQRAVVTEGFRQLREDLTAAFEAVEVRIEQARLTGRPSPRPSVDLTDAAVPTLAPTVTPDSGPRDSGPPDSGPPDSGPPAGSPRDSAPPAGGPGADDPSGFRSDPGAITPARTRRSHRR